VDATCQVGTTVEGLRGAEKTTDFERFWRRIMSVSCWEIAIEGRKKGCRVCGCLVRWWRDDGGRD
jgi:hypothetical protein